MAQSMESGLQGIDVGIFVASGERVLFVNRRLAEMLSRTDSEITGMPLSALVTEAARPTLAEALGTLATNPEISLVTHLERGEAPPLEAELRIWSREIDESRIAVGVVRDLEALRTQARQRSRMQKQIEHAAEEWRMTFDVVETPIIIIGSDGSVRRINRAARIVAGKSYEEIVNHPAERLGSREPWRTVRELAEAVVREDSPGTSQVKLEDGRIWDVLAIPFPIPGGAARRALIAAWDVTQVVELQSSLDNARAMAEIGALVAGVAHEVRNPLFAVSATLDALEQACEGRYQEHFSILHEEIDRMAKLMQHLLDYGRPSQPQFNYEEQIECVVDAAIGSHASQAATQGVTIRKVVECAPVTLFFDPERIGRALENAIHNAVLHSPEGASVVVRLMRSEENHQSWLLVRVEDLGPGFAPDHIDRVFEPFFTKRKGGTGLGLPMVRQIVEEHGGKVWVENRPGGGAIVVIRLPIQQSGPGGRRGDPRAQK
jgi:PAS domain S-box-containing protein